MKIAFIVGSFPKLSETFIINQVTGLIDRGHDVEIFASKKPEEPKQHSAVSEYNLLKKTHYPKSDISSYRNRLKKAAELFCKSFKEPELFDSFNIMKYRKESYNLSIPFRVNQFLENEKKFDIVHCHFGPNGKLGSFLKGNDLISGKLVTTFYGHDVSRYLCQEGKNTYNHLFETGDLFLCLSHHIKNRLIRLGAPPNKTIKHPIGVNPEKYNFKERNLSENETIKLLTVARLTEKKGLKYSINALSKAVNKYNNIKYRIVGDGHLKSKLKNLTKELGLQDKVKFEGWMSKSEVKEIMQWAHIFILPSVTAKDGDQEGQGLVLQEAQASGLPVITTYHDGIPEGVRDGETGFLVKPRNSKDLAEKLKYLIKNPKSWPKMGRSGRKLVEEKFNVNKLNDELVKFYQNLEGI